MGRAHIILAAALAMVCSGFSPSMNDTTDTLAASELSRAFFQVVFGLEYGSRSGDSQRVKKYTDTVSFYVQDLSSHDRAAAANDFLNSLPGAIGHFRAHVVGDTKTANFQVFLVDQSDFNTVVQRELKADALAMGARCLVGVRTRHGRILGSTAVIVADDDYLFRRCLVEEVLQGLGPMDDHPSLTKSVFNDLSNHSSFTAFDRALLNMLYHPAIRPGMTGTQVQRLLPSVLRDLGFR